MGVALVVSPPLPLVAPRGVLMGDWLIGVLLPTIPAPVMCDDEDELLMWLELLLALELESGPR